MRGNGGESDQLATKVLCAADDASEGQELNIRQRQQREAWANDSTQVTASSNERKVSCMSGCELPVGRWLLTESLPACLPAAKEMK